jgi:hypothetical protein
LRWDKSHVCFWPLAEESGDVQIADSETAKARIREFFPSYLTDLTRINALCPNTWKALLKGDIAQWLFRQESCESSGLHILAEDAKIRLSSEQKVETRCRKLSCSSCSWR